MGRARNQHADPDRAAAESQLDPEFQLQLDSDEAHHGDLFSFVRVGIGLPAAQNAGPAEDHRLAVLWSVGGRGGLDERGGLAGRTGNGA